MQVVILSGGLATRLRPVTERMPKALVLVAGRPFVDYQLELLAREGVTDIVLCIGYRGEQIKAYCGNGSRYGVRIRYSEDGPRLLGTGGALKCAAPYLWEQFCVLFGDAYLQCPYRTIWQRFARERALGLMTVFENRDAYGPSNVVIEGGLVTVYDKARHTPDMIFIDYGVSLFRRDALSFILAETASDLGDLNRALIARGQLLAHEVSTRFYEIGSPTGLQEFDTLVRSGALTHAGVHP